MVASEQRKKTISIGGTLLTCFTKTLAKEKASVEKNIERTPLLKIARFSRKAGYEVRFFDFPLQPQSVPQDVFEEKDRERR